MKRALVPSTALVLAVASGCQFYARSPEDYRQATRAVVETRNDEIKACYDGMLNQGKEASGSVYVKFSVAEETGAIKDAVVLPDSTAPAPLGECVVNALDGLTLDPPDERKGEATFMWDFQRES